MSARRLQMQRNLLDENKQLKAEKARLQKQVESLTAQLRTLEAEQRKNAEQRQLLAKWGVR